jgi:hypothetical protein
MEPRGDDEQADWWATPKKKKRRFVPLVAIATIVLGLVGGAGYFVLGPRAGLLPSSGTTGASASAVEDPATLEPLSFAPRSPAGDEIFGKRMATFTIALDQARGDPDAGPGTDLGRAMSALAMDDVKAAIGERAATALDGVAKAALEASRATFDDETKADALEIAVAKLDNALITARLPYFVDTSVMVDRGRSRRLVVLYGFAIVSSSLYASSGSRVRAVRVRRIDKLNWSHNLLGFVKPRRLQAIVLLDQIDEQLVNHVLPALAEGAGMPLLAPEASTVPVSKEAAGISERAGAQTREEVLALPGIDAAAVNALGEMLRVRRALFEHWDTKLKSVRSPAARPRGRRRERHARSEGHCGAQRARRPREDPGSVDRARRDEGLRAAS